MLKASVVLISSGTAQVLRTVEHFCLANGVEVDESGALHLVAARENNDRQLMSEGTIYARGNWQKVDVIEVDDDE